jgi:hypothetical protein
MWDAVWFSRQVVNKNLPAMLVLIGDGENNVGSCTAELAIAIAKKYNIRFLQSALGQTAQ